MSLQDVISGIRFRADELAWVLRGWADTAHRTPRRKLQLAELEDRLMLSASPIAAVFDPALAGLADATESVALYPFGTASTGTVNTPDLSPTEFVGSFSESAAAVDAAAELVFVDTGVNGYEQLVADLLDDAYAQDRKIEVHMLHNSRDGIEQISSVLENKTNIDAVHIVSHGTDGAVQLGDAWLNQDNLAAYAPMIGGWHDALSADADLLFYGCDLASNAEGQTLVESLSALTVADVAASVDDTGHAKYGGDWDLEYASGEIETQVAFSSELQRSWVGKLANITVDTFDDVVSAIDGLTSLREAIIASNAGGGGDTIDLRDLGPGTFTLTIGGTGDDAGSTGDLDITNDVTIRGDGAGETIIDGNSIDRVFDVQSGTVTIRDLTIQNGSVAANGGGILQLGGTSLTLNDVHVKDNVATGGGKAGGLFTSGVTVMDGVTFSNNDGQQGGAIGVAVVGNLTVTNATFSGNISSAGGGGGIYNDGVATITHSTFTLNDGGSKSGAIINKPGGTVTIQNSILVGNLGGINTDYEGDVTSNGFNIVGDSSGSIGFGGTDILDGAIVSPVLDSTLQDNGGPTSTHALLAGSQAIDPVGLTGAPPTDQRGQMRDGSPDIGAYEYIANIAPTITSTPGSTAYTEGDGRLFVDNGISVTDANDANLESASVRIVVNFTATEDTLYFTNQNGITGNYIQHSDWHSIAVRHVFGGQLSSGVAIRGV